MVRATVVGGGSLGVKIIGELAYHGHEVCVYDCSIEALDRVRIQIQEDKRLLAEDGILLTNDFLGEIYYMTRLEDAVKTSDFVFEAAPDNIELKQQLFEMISQFGKRNAVIATNSMNLNIDDIAKRALCKERCLGMRFLFPVYCIPEVELSPGSFTSGSTLEKVRLFLARMGKVPFFRSGNNPVILSSEQRKAKKSEFIRNLQQHKGNSVSLKHYAPKSADKQSLPKATDRNQEKRSPRENDCAVCMDAERNCVLHPCHHLCTCLRCGKLLLKRQDACPICRQQISSVFRVFHS